MLCRESNYFQVFIKYLFIPPIHINGIFYFIFLQKSRYSKRCINLRIEFLREQFECRQIKMIIMIVTQQYYVQRRQILESNPRRSHPFWTRPTERACPLTVDRIGQDIYPIYLDKKG